MIRRRIGKGRWRKLGKIQLNGRLFGVPRHWMTYFSRDTQKARLNWRTGPCSPAVLRLTSAKGPPDLGHCCSASF